MPTVLRDSSRLIQLLVNTVLSYSNRLLVTMDKLFFVSLYPNPGTEKALVTLDLLSRGTSTQEPIIDSAC